MPSHGAGRDPFKAIRKTSQDAVKDNRRLRATFASLMVERHALIDNIRRVAATSRAIRRKLPLA